MKLSKTAKTVIGVLTLLQLFSVLGFLIWLFASAIPRAVMAGESAGPEFAVFFLGGVLFWTVFISVYTFGMMVFYLVHVGTNDQISIGMKILWIVLILTFSFISEVVYFFLDILPEKSLSAKLEQS